jgi:hypothetical protein
VAIKGQNLLNRHHHENIGDRNYNGFTKQMKEKYERLGLKLLIVKVYMRGEPTQMEQPKTEERSK